MYDTWKRKSWCMCIRTAGMFCESFYLLNFIRTHERRDYKRVIHNVKDFKYKREISRRHTGKKFSFLRAPRSKIIILYTLKKQSSEQSFRELGSQYRTLSELNKNYFLREHSESVGTRGIRVALRN